MRKYLFILGALLSFNASAQTLIDGVTTISYIPAAAGNHGILYGVVNSEYLESSYVVDPGLFKAVSFDGELLIPGKLYRFVIRDGQLDNVELVEDVDETKAYVRSSGYDPHLYIREDKPYDVGDYSVYTKEKAQQIVDENNWVSTEDSREFDFDTTKLEGPYVELDGVRYTKAEYDALFKFN